MRSRTVVVVEGTSDRAAVELLAARRGLDLARDGVEVVPIGGAQAIRRFLEETRARDPDARIAGLCDANEEPLFRRALERAGFGRIRSREDLEARGFFVCDRDLEDELVRALGAEGVERVLEEQGHLRRFRTYRKQEAHRAQPLDRQLHGFLHNHKFCCGPALVAALERERLPGPLAGLLAHVAGERLPASANDDAADVPNKRASVEDEGQSEALA